jgi:hypothetical protein
MNYYYGAPVHYQKANVPIASIAAVTTLEVTFTMPGADVGDFFIGVPSTAFTNGLGIQAGRISAANTGKLPIVNGSAGAIDPADTFTFDLFLFKKGGKTLAAT